MTLNDRINILASFGNDLAAICDGKEVEVFPGFEKIKVYNPWFTEDNVRFCLQNWHSQLNRENLAKFCSSYNIDDNLSDFCVAIVMAGNIPMVGFHDFACAFLCGVRIEAKLSSKDNVLMKWAIEQITAKLPELAGRITHTEERLSDFDAVIATGSNNTNRYFEYYFGKYDKILRHNRNSVAIITGDETDEELSALADDVFMYFGLGCRSVSKLYLPRGYDFNRMGEAFQKYADIINHNKYNNNYSYQYAVMGMNKIEHVNFGHLLLTEKKDLNSPIGVLHFEYYDDIKAVENELVQNAENIQCIVAKSKFSENCVNFGDTQKPNIYNFADNIDTIKFITGLCRK
ncbi:MAG: hypothetical protein II575_05590 [Bacteroidales bacterium]|nr:hypothetical protein [Bacteroidales bacterium]